MQHGGVEETRWSTIGRRLKTIPPRYIGAILVTVLFPALLVLALLVDAGRWITRRRPFMASRLLCLLWLYLVGESVCIVGFGLSWIFAIGPRRAEILEHQAWQIQQFWAWSLFAPARALFRLSFSVEGHDVVEPGPIIVLLRHASIIDNLLPSVVISRPHGIDLRYLIKRELLADPGLDVGGNRLKNYFVRRDTGAEIERENVRRLAEGLTPTEGMLIFPEGTRFTPERRARAIEKIGERDPQLAKRAEQFVNQLPPKPGGVLAMLDGAPGVDVVLLAHAGFDGLRLVSDIWRGELVGRAIRVRLTRVPRSEIPEGREKRVAWLFDAWLEVDRWVGAQLARPE